MGGASERRGLRRAALRVAPTHDPIRREIARCDLATLLASVLAPDADKNEEVVWARIAPGLARYDAWLAHERGCVALRSPDLSRDAGTVSSARVMGERRIASPDALNVGALARGQRDHGTAYRLDASRVVSAGQGRAVLAAREAGKADRAQGRTEASARVRDLVGRIEDALYRLGAVDPADALEIAVEIRDYQVLLIAETADSAEGPVRRARPGALDAVRAADRADPDRAVRRVDGVEVTEPVIGRGYRDAERLGRARAIAKALR